MKGRKRRSSDRYHAFEGGEHIPAPDYTQFRVACDQAAKQLGMKGDDVYRVYKAFLNCSIEMMFPEGNPRDLSDEELLNPSRHIQIPRVASLEVTPNSLRRWRTIEGHIKNKRDNNA